MGKRFGSATMIAGAMASAIAFYTLSLHVSAERAKADKLRAGIAADLRDIRALEAELRTRARLPVLQRWNDDVLAMSAPTSKQFADSPIQLAAFAPGGSQPAAAPGVLPAVPEPTVQLAVAMEPAAPQLPIVRASYQTPMPQEIVIPLPAERSAPVARPAQTEPKQMAVAEARKPEAKSVPKSEPKKAETKTAEARKPEAKKPEAKPERKAVEAPVRLAEAKPTPAPKAPAKPALDSLDALAGAIDSAAAAERGVAFRKVSMQ